MLLHRLRSDSEKPASRTAWRRTRHSQPTLGITDSLSASARQKKGSPQVLPRLPLQRLLSGPLTPHNLRSTTNLAGAAHLAAAVSTYSFKCPASARKTKSSSALGRLVRALRASCHGAVRGPIKGRIPDVRAEARR